MVSRRTEVISGILAGLFGLAALGVGLFAPSTMRCVDTTVSGGQSGCFPVSLVQVQGLASLSFAIALFGTLSLSIAFFAVWHSRARTLPVLVLLWLSTGLLFFATLLALLSIGALFLPADVLAFVASLAGTVAAGQRVHAHV